MFQCPAPPPTLTMFLLLLIACFLAPSDAETCSNKEIEDKLIELDARFNKFEKDCATKSELQDLKAILGGLRDLPYLTMCAYKVTWTTASATITYDKIVADFNNSDRPNGGDGILDIATGEFTSLTAGHYTVTYSGVAAMHPGNVIRVYIHLNGNNLGQQAIWASRASTAASSELIYDQGSRTMVRNVGSSMFTTFFR